MNDVLKIYLESGLLDIGDDDNRLASLENAASELAERFEEEPRKALYHALTLYSPFPPSNDASFVEAGAALSNYWSTYRNRFKDNPREILKPVSFRALQLAAAKNTELELALGYLLRTVPKAANPTREQVILEEFARILEDKAEVEALDQWAISGPGREPVPAIPSPSVLKIDRESIAAAITLAAGPQNVQGQPVSGANPNFPQASAAWTGDFGTRLSEILAGNLEQALLRFTKEVQKEVNKSITKTNTHLNNDSPIIRRARLLWWEKSSFSSRLRRPYGEMSRPLRILAMVEDFYEISGNIAPYSAEYFLKKTVKAVCGNEALKTSDLIDTGNSPAEKLFATLPIRFEERVGEKTLAESLVSRGSPAAKGREADSSYPEFLAARIFNELQALTLADSARGASK